MIIDFYIASFCILLGLQILIMATLMYVYTLKKLFSAIFEFRQQTAEAQKAHEYYMSGFKELGDWIHSQNIERNELQNQMHGLNEEVNKIKRLVDDIKPTNPEITFQ